MKGLFREGGRCRMVKGAGSREVKGAESIPFELPSRWDFKSLIMIKDHVQLTVDKDISIDKLYFKKCGRSKALVVVNGDLDVTSMLREYPGFQWMYMAVDWHVMATSKVFICIQLIMQNAELQYYVTIR